MCRSSPSRSLASTTNVACIKPEAGASEPGTVWPPLDTDTSRKRLEARRREPARATVRLPRTASTCAEDALKSKKRVIVEEAESSLAGVDDMSGDVKVWRPSEAPGDDAVCDSVEAHIEGTE
jgi:hypothetical protein